MKEAMERGKEVLGETEEPVKDSGINTNRIVIVSFFLAWLMSILYVLF